jgi:hypothetical protein
LPLWSLKPPYFPETTLVSPLSETPTEEKNQQDSLQGVNRELGDPPDSSSPEGQVKFEGASQGYESSSGESVGEENNRDNGDTDESIEEDEKGVENNIGDCDTDEEEEGAVTVLKLSNGVMFRVPVKVQGMQLQHPRLLLVN